MPFTEQTPRPYTHEDVEKLAKDQMGCYGIFREGVWIYVGSGDIRQRLLDHLNGDNPCIVQQNPTLYVADVLADYKEREKQLIDEYAPICNQRRG